MVKFENLKMEQVALANFAYNKFSLDYTLDSFQRLGVHNIEFYCAYPHFYLEDSSLWDMKVLRRKLREHELNVIDVCPENCTYPMNLGSADPAVRERTFRTYVKGIEAAVEWDCTRCLFFPGWTTFDGSQEEAWLYGKDAMARLADIAEVNGVKIIMESASSASTVLTSIKKMKQMIDEINSPALSGMLDLVCLFITGDTTKDSVATLGMNNINHIHFSDGQLLPDGSWERLVPGQGKLPLEDILKILSDNHYPFYFGCEMFNRYKKNPEEAMRQTLEWCRERFTGGENGTR